MAENQKNQQISEDIASHKHVGQEAAHIDGGAAQHHEQAHQLNDRERHTSGQEAQHNGQKAHQLTKEERSEGGSHSGGNFKNDPQRASEAGRKGSKS